MRANLTSGPAFVTAVVPFDEVAIGLRHRPVTGKLAGAYCALQRTREYFGKACGFQSIPKPLGLGLAFLCQRKVGQSGVLARYSPLGRTMPNQVYIRKRSAHMNAPSSGCTLTSKLQLRASRCQPRTLRWCDRWRRHP